MNLLNRLILLLVIGIFTHSTVDAQLSPNDFLLTAFEDPSLIEYQKKFNYLQKKNYLLPLGDELEFRYGNNEQTLEDARYQVRIRPTNPWKIRRTNALYNAQKEAISLRESIEFKEALFERYSLMIQYFIAQKQTKLSNASLTLAENKIQLFEKSIESELFNAQNYVDAKLDMIEMLERYDNHKLIEDEFIQNITFILATDDINWSDFNLISSVEIKNVMNEILLSSFSNSELTYLMKEFEIAKLETLVEKADFDIGFFQAEYAPFKNNGDNEFGISFGITVPIFKNNKDQIADRILNEIEWYSDQMRAGNSPEKPQFIGNQSGGILGGISSGQPIIVRVAIKPTSSILTPRQSIDRDGKNVDVVTKGRHDPCVGIRGVPVAEAMMSLVLVDMLMRHHAQTGILSQPKS